MSSNSAESKKKFSHTRELVKIALDDGMSQTEIARMCRTSQSVVSGWLNGTSRAKMTAIRPLIERYGSRLSRVSAKYYIAEPASVDRSAWKTTESGQRMSAIGRGPLSDQELELLKEVLGAAEVERACELRVREDDLVECAKQELEDRGSVDRIVRVEGPIIFRQVFRNWILIARSRRSELEAFPTTRCVIHQVGPSQFQLVIQRRRELRGRARLIEQSVLHKDWKDASREAEHTDSHDAFARRVVTWRYVDCADDDGRWIATIEGPYDSQALLARCGQIESLGIGRVSRSDALTFPLLVRKTLLQLGATTDGA